MTYGRMTTAPPNRMVYQVRTNECLQFIAAKGGFNTNVSSKTYLGREELLQLIDYDVSLLGCALL
jgi:hypothetical protein